MESGDVAGIIADCLKTLQASGFDADAFLTTRWAGLACLFALAVSAILGFAAGFWKDGVTPPLGDGQFRAVLYVGALLLALPVVTQVTAEGFDLQLGSGDRAFAQDICRDRQEAVTQSAEIAALETRLSVQVEELRSEIALARIDPQDFPLELPMIVTPVRPEILGTPVAVYYRSGRQADAQTIRDILSDAGAGVALRNTDLSETSRAATAAPGDIYILSDARADAAPEVIATLLEDEAGVAVTGRMSVDSLAGTPVQILLY